MSIWIVPGSYPVIRGGSWLYVPQYAWVADRRCDDLSDRYSNLGLRLVRRLP